MANSDTETWRIERQHPDGHELSGSERRPLNNRARTGGGRGRSAEKPSDIPARGWKDILWRVYAGISDDRILANAAAVTFYALLALFPRLPRWCRSTVSLQTRPASSSTSTPFLGFCRAVQST